MKTTLHKPTKNSGSILMVGLLTAAILGLLLLSYLSLIYWQNNTVARSQSWNTALTVAEAGVEEALAQLNPRGINFSSSKPVDRSANGWGTSVDGYGPVNRNLLVGDYRVTISADDLPVITSRGHTIVPSLKADLYRRVRVQTRNSPAFGTAMAAILDIDFKGTTLSVDSFDSSDNQYSTLGRYDPAKRKAGGDVASSQGFVNVQNANINGKILTGPDGSYSFGPGGFAGPVGFSGPGLYSPDWYRNDFNMNFPDVVVPFTTGSTPQSKAVAGTNYTYVLGNGNYIINGDVNMQNNGDGDKMYVSGDAALYVTGNFSMSGNKTYIYIAYGAKLRLFVGGASASFTRVNTEGNAYTFQYYGLPTNSSVTWNGNDAFLGTVYAPQAEFTLGGGGATPYDYQGACVVKSAKLNGHFNFHYDENLQRLGPWSGYQAARWEEIAPL